MKISDVNIYNFLDLPQYLREYYQTRKKIDPKFSYRKFSEEAGLANWWTIFSDVLRGVRHVPVSAVSGYSKALGLTKIEREYLLNLVMLDKARKDVQKQEFLKKLHKLRTGKTTGQIGEKQFRLFGKWYYDVVKKLATGAEFSGDVEALYKRVVPSITKSQAERALRLLVKLGIISKKGKKYQKKAPHSSTEKEVNSLTVRNFHKQMINLGSESVERFPREERFLSGLSLYIPKNRYKYYSDKIWDFGQALKEEAGKEEKEDTVYQMNVQFFPMTRDFKEKKKKTKK